MKQNVIAVLLMAISMAFGVQSQCFCQSNPTVSDSVKTDGPFHAYIYNKEYKVFIKIDAYAQNITVPGQEVFGEMAGYFKSDDDSRCWLITSVEIAPDGRSAILEITNDYGSEDLEASLTVEADGSYTLKQLDGSTLKIARNRKWVKMPKSLNFVRK